jgi:tetratricopeptide (TPR) repeat protein
MLAVQCSSFFQVFWTSRDLVMTRIPDTSQLSHLAVQSSQEEWERTGRLLFNQKRYAHAMQCFKRASLQKEAAVANAYLLREDAQAMPSGEHGDEFPRTQAFTDAAEAFIKSAASATLQQITYYRIAAECFQECAKLSQAARSYIDAREFDHGAQIYLDAGMHSHAIRVIHEHKRDMRHDIVDQILFKCRLYYFQKLELMYV